MSDNQQSSGTNQPATPPTPQAPITRPSVNTDQISLREGTELVTHTKKLNS